VLIIIIIIVVVVVVIIVGGIGEADIIRNECSCWEI
jgi:hypothetical protein